MAYKHTRKRKNKVNKYAMQVKEFNDTFCADATDKMYRKLVREEFNEWFTEMEENPTSEHELKELCDLLYVVYGYAHTQNWDIERNNKEVGIIVSKVNEFTDRFPDVHIAATIITTAYAEFISSYEYIWLYRFAQGIFSYAKLKGFPLEKAFARVHKSNMSKLEDGKVLRREDGKVLKGKDYKPAQLKDLLYENKVVAIKSRNKKSAG